jgi:hypothetical protein
MAASRWYELIHSQIEKTYQQHEMRLYSNNNLVIAIHGNIYGGSVNYMGCFQSRLKICHSSKGS